MSKWAWEWELYSLNGINEGSLEQKKINNNSYGDVNRSSDDNKSIAGEKKKTTGRVENKGL